MLTEEIMNAYGIPEEKQKEFKALYYTDLNKSVKFSVDHQKENKTSETLRCAIVSMLPTIKSVRHLKKILSVVSSCYFYQGKDEAEQKTPVESEVKE